MQAHPNVTKVPKFYPDEESSYSQKEIFFFCLDNLYRKGIKYYEDHLTPQESGTKRIFDASTYYLTDPKVPFRIQAAYPAQELRFVVLLRDPVDRAESIFRFMQFHRVKPFPKSWLDGLATFEEKAQNSLAFHHECHARFPMNDLSTYLECIPQFKNDMLHVGMYDQQLDIWEQIFPKRFFCIISSDFFRENTTKVLQLVTDFVGLPPHHWKNNSTCVNCVSNSINATSSNVLQEIHEFYEKIGRKRYDFVKVHGYEGCLPNAQNYAQNQHDNVQNHP